MHFQDKIQDILNWLKVRLERASGIQLLRSFVSQAIQPIPEDLIQRWKAYQFMFFWETLHHQVTMFLGFEVRRDLNQVFLLSPQMLRALQTKMDRLSPVSVADCRRFLTQSPEFIRIFQARGLLNSCLFRSPYRLSHLYHLRLLLNLSWDDITAAFSALSSFIGTGTLKQVVAGIITVLALSFELYPANTSSLISDLASGFLHFIQRIGAGKLPLSVW
jgi:hypothetical protein